MSKIKSIRGKLIIGMIITLLINAQIANLILKVVERIYEFEGVIGVVINTGINILTTVAILIVLVNFIVIKPINMAPTKNVVVISKNHQSNKDTPIIIIIKQAENVNNANRKRQLNLVTVTVP